MAAIYDKSRKGEGAMECMAKQYRLVQEGKFDEALKYYSKKIIGDIIEELKENPDAKKEWKAATNLPEDKFQEMLNYVKENPDFFVFEDGMWKITDK